MILDTLINWLEKQDKDMVIKDGFGSPHADRGCYANLSFDPTDLTTAGDMLAHARGSLDRTFRGYKGGYEPMTVVSNVLIGYNDDIGCPITTTHLKYWELQESSRREIKRASMKAKLDLKRSKKS